MQITWRRTNNTKLSLWYAVFTRDSTIVETSFAQEVGSTVFGPLGIVIFILGGAGRSQLQPIQGPWDREAGVLHADTTVVDLSVRPTL
eukprot:5754185-Amphidinium_carterae.3